MIMLFFSCITEMTCALSRDSIAKGDFLMPKIQKLLLSRSNSNEFTSLFIKYFHGILYMDRVFMKYFYDSKNYRCTNIKVVRAHMGSCDIFGYFGVKHYHTPLGAW